MSKRAKLAHGKKVVFEPSSRSVPRLKAVGGERVFLSPNNIGESANRWIKLLAGSIVLGILLIVMIYLGLAATLMTSVPGEGNSRVWVARGTFVGGTVPAGSMVYASASSPKPSDAIERIVEGTIGTPNGLVAEVVTGPFGNIENNGEQILNNGTVISGYTGAVEPYFLDNEYLAVCQQGSCQQGELIIIPSRNISGEAQATISLAGVKPLDNYED